MSDLDRELLRRLAGWSSNQAPVASFYLNVDGRRFPRKQDYEVRAEELCHRLRQEAARLPREQRRSVERDAERFLAFVKDLDRGPTRGVALLSASADGLWEEVLVPRPVPDLVTVAPQPYVLPLEALLETYQSFCTVLVDREKARVFFAALGRIQEETDVFDEVPGQHDQGGWSQARYQRHIEAHVQDHLRRVADLLLRYSKRRPFDHLILAGPEELLPHFERELHDYLRRRVVARTSLPMTATPAEVLERSLQVEEELEARREREALERVRAQAAAGQGAVVGLGSVLDALNQGRVGTLVVPFGLAREGVRCAGCGWLAEEGETCPTCQEPTELVPDVVDLAVASALRQGARVETLSHVADVEVGALLRF
ncbi:MAG TPA: Vms1/Ankzf1 family peptidyl-tRNA hydrolase [Actinomycetota bacterium]|nr:Vms1/Ankzf1 family peptidyl-tRNA hydrolase [Actinomycetota bacterium]